MTTSGKTFICGNYATANADATDLLKTFICGNYATANADATDLLKNYATANADATDLLNLRTYQIGIQNQNKKSADLSKPAQTQIEERM